VREVLRDCPHDNKQTFPANVPAAKPPKILLALGNLTERLLKVAEKASPLLMANFPVPSQQFFGIFHLPTAPVERVAKIADALRILQPFLDPRAREPRGQRELVTTAFRIPGKRQFVISNRLHLFLSFIGFITHLLVREPCRRVLPAFF
jgi:hypothetical protein